MNSGKIIFQQNGYRPITHHIKIPSGPCPRDVISMSENTDLDKKITSEITSFGKYSRYVPDLNRRETWLETVARSEKMYLDKFSDLYDNDSDFKEMLDTTFDAIRAKKILPSMRSMQFGGPAIEVSNNRMYNCAFMPVDSYTAFSEAMFLLLGGTGVGYSVERKNVDKLSPRRESKDKYLHVEIDDSIEGWADAIRECVVGVMEGMTVNFDYSKIRPKGTPLKTSGGKAPGPAPLQKCVEDITHLLESKVPVGEKMTPLIAHDIMCHLASAVLSGGIRRSAMISLFDKEEDEMIMCKSTPDWYEVEPQRAMANNSVVFDRTTATKEEFTRVWDKTKSQRWGEPGVYFTNDIDEGWGTNPCCEISLKNHSFCNLSEVNCSDADDDLWPLDLRFKCAAFIGTAQATFTDLPYLRDMWKKTTEEDALIGVSMTGVGSGAILTHDLTRYAEIVKETNAIWADRFGINRAARTTCIKPAGTSSLVLGTSSGVHAWHNDHYIRRQRINTTEPLYQYLEFVHPELIEQCEAEAEREKGLAIIRTPVKAPANAILRHETALDFLERVKKFSTEWVKPGHRTGINTHNVSATVSIRDDEWDTVGEWMWENREHYNGIAVINFDVGGYKQPPHEDCTPETYETLMKTLSTVDLRNVTEVEDLTDTLGEVACAGGLCEIDTHYEPDDLDANA